LIALCCGSARLAQGGRIGFGILFINKRDNSQLDYLTISETSYTPPNPNEEGINSPKRLGLEVTMIHQKFMQQILKSQAARKCIFPIPFLQRGCGWYGTSVGCLLLSQIPTR
jgi:hypothetical protein